MNSKLYDVLSTLYDINVKLNIKDDEYKGLFFNGNSGLLTGVPEWGEDQDTEGSLQKLLSRAESLNQNADSIQPDTDSENILSSVEILSKGASDEVSGFGLKHSASAMYQMAENQNSLMSIGPCSGIGIAYNQNDGSVLLVWKDPDDFVVGGNHVLDWERTELWRREGSTPPYPGDPDSTLITTTGKDLTRFNPRDNFYKKAYKDTTTSLGTTYTYKLFSYTSNGVCNNLQENQYPLTSHFSWPMLHVLSQAGILLNYVSIGDTFTFNHKDYGEVPVVFVGYDEVVPTYKDINPHAALFQTVDCIDNMPIDCAETMYSFTEDIKVETR